MTNDNAGSALSFRKLDNSTDIDLLIQQIKEILLEGRSHNLDLYDRAYWEWQYKNLPTERSMIYVCTFEERIVGYYHVPVYQGVVEGEKKLFAMVQDVAVSAKMRGTGVFRKLAAFATHDLENDPDISLVYTFPNAKSIHTFLKYDGYNQIYSYDSFVLPVSSSAVISSKFRALGIEKLLGLFADKYFDLRSKSLSDGFEVIRKDDFDDETIALFTNFGSKFGCHLDRSREYMNWRYFENPKGEHFLFVLKDAVKVLAAAVCKLDDILNAKTCVLMDFAYDNERHLGQLLHHLRKNSDVIFNEKIAMIYASFCCRPLLRSKMFGFIKVPQRFNPRPLNLLVKNLKEDDKTVYQASNWLAVLGDWDVL